jgi:hypothetical protein
MISPYSFLCRYLLIKKYRLEEKETATRDYTPAIYHIPVPATTPPPLLMPPLRTVSPAVTFLHLPARGGNNASLDLPQQFAAILESIKGTTCYYTYFIAVLDNCRRTAQERPGLGRCILYVRLLAANHGL